MLEGKEEENIICRAKNFGGMKGWREKVIHHMGEGGVGLLITLQVSFVNPKVILLLTC